MIHYHEKYFTQSRISTTHNYATQAHPLSNDEFQTTSHQHNRPRQGQERRALELLKYTIPATVTGLLELYIELT